MKHVTGVLQMYIGLMDTFVRDSFHFVGKLKSMEIQPEDMWVSFEVCVPVHDGYHV